MGAIKRILSRIKINRICKLNGYYCPDCIYHDWDFEGVIFRGNRCRLEEENHGR